MTTWQFYDENPFCISEAYDRAEQRDLEGACCMVSRKNKGWVIHDAIETFGLEHYTQLQLNRAIEYAYCSDDFPSYHRNDLWYYLLEGVYQPAKKYNKNKVPNTIKLYRGGQPNAWSWTKDIEKAKWFSQRWKNIDKLETGLWQTTVSSDEILFFGDESYEGEVVLRLDRGDRNIEQVKEAQE